MTEGFRSSGQLLASEMSVKAPVRQERSGGEVSSRGSDGEVRIPVREENLAQGQEGVRERLIFDRQSDETPESCYGKYKTELYMLPPSFALLGVGAYLAYNGVQENDSDKIKVGSIIVGVGVAGLVAYCGVKGAFRGWDIDCDGGC